MASAIKGITIPFRGDTTQLDKALRTIRTESKGVDKELREINRALKFNPGNAELLQQKFTVLKQKINGTEQELKQYKQAQATMKAQGVDKNSEQWRTVQRRIIEAESKLKHFNAELMKVKYANITAVGSAFQSAGQKMRTAGTYATMAGGAMVLAGKKLLDMNQVQADAENKLIEIYKTRMGVDKKAAKSTMAVATALQKQGVIGDEVTLSGAQQLATYAKMPKTVNTLLPAMNNLLVQQKGYNASAEDAQGIANLFGKAMMGQVGALKRVGISFSDAQAEILKTGTEEEKAAVLAEVVTQNVGNMNEEFAKTDAGKIAQAKNTLGDLGEKLGALLLPALGKFADYLSKNVLPKLEKFINYLQNNPGIAKFAAALAGILVIGGPLVAALGGLMGAVGGLIKGFVTVIRVVNMFRTSLVLMKVASVAATVAQKAMAAAQWLLNAAMSANPIGLIIIGIAALIAIVALLWKKSKTFREFIMKMWQTIKTKLLAIWNTLKTAALTVWNGIKNNIINPIKNAWKTVKDKFTALKTWLKEKWEGIKTTAKEVWNGIKKKITAPITAAKDALKKIIKKIKGLFPINVGKLIKFLLPKIGVKKGSGKKNVLGYNVNWKNGGGGGGKSKHAKGGIFNRATLLPTANAVHEVGERGPEAILPLNSLWAEMGKMMNSMADSIVNGVVMANRLGASGGGDIVIPIYLYPNGPKMGEQIVRTYDQYKKILG